MIEIFDLSEWNQIEIWLINSGRGIQFTVNGKLAGFGTLSSEFEIQVSPYLVAHRLWGSNFDVIIQARYEKLVRRDDMHEFTSSTTPCCRIC